VLGTIKVQSDISVLNLRKALFLLAQKKEIKIDQITGQLFVAGMRNNKGMKLINSAAMLADAFSGANTSVGRGKVVHFGIGARHTDFDPELLAASSQDSGHGIKNLRAPPLEAGGTVSTGVRAAAEVNVQRVNVVRAFLEELYFNVDSTLHYGMTKYHYGVIFEELTKKHKAGDPQQLITDVEHNVWPQEEDFSKYSPDGVWNTNQHRRASCNCPLQKGAYPPDDKGEIPMADLCKKRKEAAAAGTAVAAAATTAAVAEAEAMHGMVAQMARSNDQNEARYAPQGRTLAAVSVTKPTQQESATDQLFYKIDQTQKLKDIAIKNGNVDAEVKYTARIDRYLSEIDALADSQGKDNE